MAALVNIVPLFMGSRAPIIDALHIPQSWHRRLHAFLGILVALEAISHTIIAVSLRPKRGELTLSGWVVRNRIAVWYVN